MSVKKEGVKQTPVWVAKPKAIDGSINIVSKVQDRKMPYQVCRVWREEDAPIIASAPMLYEACKIALAESKRADLHFKSVSPATVMLEKALSSAEGRG